MAGELERDTAGNPFFLLEMARHLSDLGAFDQEGPGSVSQRKFLNPCATWSAGGCAGVSDGCAEVLEIASVIGERFDAALVASAASGDEAATC